MTRNTVTLADFCHFTIRQMEQDSDYTLLRGQVSKPGRLYSGQQLSIFQSPQEQVDGVLIELNPDSGTAVLKVLNGNLNPEIVRGAKFPLCDTYWSDKLFLALSDDVQWTRRQFVAPDAFVEPAETPGWNQSRIATEADRQRTDGQIVPGGWDHEHCEICWRHIEMDGESEGYVNELDRWVCVGCYERFVGPRDLRFALEGAADDSGDDPNLLTPFQQIEELIAEYDLPALRRFLDETGSVNSRSKYGWRPLMLAASRGHQSLVSLLLDAAADVNAVSEQHDYTALALAAQKGFVPIVESLLNAGARVQVPETFFNGSILNYVKTGPGHDNPRVFELLVGAGAK